MNGEKVIELGEGANLQKGDRVRFTFQASGIFSPLKRFIILQRVRAVEQLRIEERDVRYTEGELIIEADVVQNPLPLALVVGGIVAAAATAMVFLSLVKVEKIVSSPAGAALAGGVGLILTALAFGVVAPRLAKAR